MDTGEGVLKPRLDFKMVEHGFKVRVDSLNIGKLVITPTRQYPTEYCADEVLRAWLEAHGEKAWITRPFSFVQWTATIGSLVQRDYGDCQGD